MKMTATLSLLLILGCTSMQQRPVATAAAQTQSQFKNLQILPRDIPREQLLTIMRGFTRSLGVKCNECHVVTATEPKEQLDFAADTKEEKRVARVMMQMTSQINGAWMERVEAAEGHHEETTEAAPSDPRVSCWTCHRGKKEPEMPPAPAPAPAATR
ncbi:MAG TPA: c-type cytochrome [Thermoanaerobaculia bacterium]